ncbi:hypothetical protein EHQ96_00025 [Leptospira levettii]|uniref:AbiTii domain-containing protein n=1 Tax=Leptospira levettii TaxID=2023178 RepID=UPI001082ED66|nr:hypothetical protein [Leptospira levettii]TGM73628.1 hypothetical protein EHQ96_00025 [Leptospira levettii]
MDNKNTYILELSKELLDDIELSRLSIEQLLLKSSRLARLTSEDEIHDWLLYELRGYQNTELGRKYMSLMNRWTDKEKGSGYWIPLSAVDAYISANEIELSKMSIPNVNFSPSSSNPHENVTGIRGANVSMIVGTQSQILNRINILKNEIITFKSIRGRAISKIHEYISNMYHTLVFSGYSETIFEKFKHEVDSFLLKNFPEVLEKIPNVYDRLSEDNEESISQALTTLRRILTSFSDKIEPAIESISEVEIEGEKIKVGKENYLNRLNYFISKKTNSTSRKQRLKQNLRNLNEKLSAGVHDIVTSSEAKALLLNLYVILGEIALL